MELVKNRPISPTTTGAINIGRMTRVSTRLRNVPSAVMARATPMPSTISRTSVPPTYSSVVSQLPHTCGSVTSVPQFWRPTKVVLIPPISVMLLRLIQIR